jgi:hypothetical protein
MQHWWNVDLSPSRSMVQAMGESADTDLVCILVRKKKASIEDSLGYPSGLSIASTRTPVDTAS